MNTAFLKDILILSFSAFGGPSAHIALALDHLVKRKNYLTEEELVELMALCSILPGPTSTQTITSIGYKLGGPVLALLTLATWVMPAIIGMSLLSFGYVYLQQQSFSLDFLRFIPAVAVGFVIYAAYKIGHKVVKSKLTGALFLLSGIAAIIFRSPWAFPIILLVGGLVSDLTGEDEAVANVERPKIQWKFLFLFALIFLGSFLAVQIFPNKSVALFESFYRFGSLVFGGGQVLIPIMQTEVVDAKNWLTNEEFLTGYGLVQGMPGPVFSFSAFAGGLAMRDGMQVLGCLLGAIGIFLPGTLLIFFVYPAWNYLKQYRHIRKAMPGINAAAGGLILAAVYVLGSSLEVTWWPYALAILSFCLLEFLKIPGFYVIFGALLLGFLL